MNDQAEFELERKRLIEETHRRLSRNTMLIAIAGIIAGAIAIGGIVFALVYVGESNGSRTQEQRMACIDSGRIALKAADGGIVCVASIVEVGESDGE